MLRELTPWALALTLAWTACDDDPEPSCTDEACSEQEAPRDASAPDARAPQAELVDASMPKRDAAPGEPPDAATNASPDAAADAATPSDAGDELEMLRQVCLDTINMYRATLDLPPMMRASASNESCSDDGAEFDSKANKAHGSAKMGAVPCRTASVAQNTCPNWTVRRGGTVADSLKQCLAQMWAEGEPPQGVDACIKDKVCFPMYGHWINMTSNAKLVSCGFYVNETQQWWMNQDFSSR